MPKKSNALGNDSVGRLVVRLAFPAIIAQGISAAWVIMFLLGKRTKLKLQFCYFRLKRSVILPVIRQSLYDIFQQYEICWKFVLSR